MLSLDGVARREIVRDLARYLGDERERVLANCPEDLATAVRARVARLGEPRPLDRLSLHRVNVPARRGDARSAERER